MKVRETVVKSLRELGRGVRPQELWDYMCEMGYDCSKSKTPEDTISSTLSVMARDPETIVTRIKDEKGKYLYYLSTYKNLNENNDKELKIIELQMQLEAKQMAYSKTKLELLELKKRALSNE